MRQKSARSRPATKPSPRAVKHGGGSYGSWGDVPAYQADASLQGVLHGLAGMGVLQGEPWGQVQQSNSLIGVLNKLRGSEHITTPYWQDPWIFSAIYRIAEAASAARLRFYVDDSEDAEEIDEGDPLNELFRRPHPLLPYKRWLRHVVTLWWCYGETPYALRLGTGDKWVTSPGEVNLGNSLTGPKSKRFQIWPIKPDCAELFVGEDTMPVHWQIDQAKSGRAAGAPIQIPAAAVAHIYSPDPMDAMFSRGMGRLEAALRTCDIDWSAERYEEAEVRTGGVPNIVVAAKKGLNEEGRKKLADEIERKHQRAEKSGKVMVINGVEYDVHFPGHSPKEMAWLELRRWNRETKIAVMGANPAWLGIIDDVNRANGEEGRRNVWQDTIAPFLEDYAGEIEGEILPMLGYEGVACQFDTSHVAALREDADKVAARAKLYFDTFDFTIEQAFELSGGTLPEDFDGADRKKSDMARESAEMQAEFAPKPAPGAVAGPPQRQQSLALFEKDEHEVGRTATWQTFADQTMAAEARVKKLAMRVLSGYIDKSIALARDIAAEGKTFAWSGSVSHDISEADLMMLLPDVGPWQERLADALMPLLGEVLESQAGYIAGSLGRNPITNRVDQYAAPFLAGKEIQIKETVVTLRDEIRKVLLRSIADGDAIGSTADQVRQVLEMYRADLKVMQDSLASRAEMIARTETASAANGARMLEAKAQGIQEMRWITARDAAVRESHAQIDGQVRPIGEAFGNGLRFPGDPETGDPGEIINCRCTVAPTARGAEAITEQAA